MKTQNLSRCANAKKQIVLDVVFNVFCIFSSVLHSVSEGI